LSFDEVIDVVKEFKENKDKEIVKIVP